MAGRGWPPVRCAEGRPSATAIDALIFSGKHIMSDKQALLRWTIAEQEKLRTALAEIESSADRADRAQEMQRIRKNLADLEIVLRSLKG